ncbi:hypothetical protein CO046_05435 [Candidatus Peregrinibacteria bacterium CG_4_9_14_0_2_um_filter_53_11]|nr:MAG: hypothetical protein CO046_05435 [Candidatus Peregrinibacteria bacterium CG_4_9_14_0_2_um_filter_53_11]
MRESLISPLLRIGSTIIFSVTLIVSLLFVYGYQYDTDEQQLIKKSVVYFDDMTTTAGRPDVAIDGLEVEPFLNKNEFRLSPGEHSFEVHKSGFVSWKKRVSLDENMIIHFKALRLLPADFFPERTVFGPDWRLLNLNAHGLYLYNENLHAVRLVEAEVAGHLKLYDVLFTAEPEEYALTEELGLIVRTKQGAVEYFDPKEAEVRIIADSTGGLFQTKSELLVLSSEGKLLHLIEDEPAFAIYNDLADRSFEKVLMVEESTDGRYLVIHGLPLAEKSSPSVLQEPQLLILDRNKQTTRELSGAVRFFLDDKLLHLIAADGSLSTVSLDPERLTGEPLPALRLPAKVSWVSRVGGTLHLLMRTIEGDLLYCDEGAENCHVLASELTGERLVASSDFEQFIGVAGQSLVLVDLSAGASPRFFDRFVSAF